jgi:hypothetical protein
VFKSRKPMSEQVCKKYFVKDGLSNLVLSMAYERLKLKAGVLGGTPQA